MSLTLALLLGALSLFAAAPVQAQNPVWTATLNVQDLGGGDGLGCLERLNLGANDCRTETTLSEDEFSVDGTSYSVRGVQVSTTGALLLIRLAGTPNTALRALNFCVGNRAFSLSGLSSSAAPSVTHNPNPVLTWTAGTSVSLSIASSCTTQSTDATLSGLTASSSASAGGTFTTLNIGTFASGTTSYTATVANSITHVKLTPTVNDSNATVKVGKGSSLTTVTSASASGAIPLSVGANAITVQVTAQDGTTTQTYTVTITRQAAAQSSNANLSGLTASSATSSGGPFSALNIGTFSATTTSYTATVPNSITHVKLRPTVSHASATVTVQSTAVTSGSESTAISLSVGSNAITVRVTAQNGTTKDYTVTITRQAPTATPTVSLSVSPTTVTEGSSVTVTVMLSAALSSSVTIPLSISTASPNTAESGDVGTLASITIAVNSTTGTGTITANQDADEDDETFTVSLGSPLPSSVAAGSPNSVQVTITDDDNPLRIFATPACGSTVSDMSVQPTWQLRLTPARATEEAVEYVFVNAGGTPFNNEWINTVFTIPESGQTSTIHGSTFAQYRAVYHGFAGVKYRLRNQPSVEASCTWQFDDSGGDPPPDDRQSPPDTGGSTPGGTPGGGGSPPSGGGGGGGGGSGGGGGGGPPAQSSDASLETLEIEEDSLDLDPQKDDYTRDAYGETSLTLTPTASDSRARITVDGNSVRSGTPYTVTLEDDGETVIEIVVTAEDGTTRTYTITVMSCPGEDKENLVRLYDATGGDNWDDNTYWKSEEPLGQWFGVDTDEDGEVLSLRLADNNLSGDMPTEELLCLNEDTELKELALWDNDGLSGEEPDELALAVERAALRDVAENLSLNAQWFEDYEDPFNFSDWHGGVTTDEEGRVTGLDFTGEDITGEIPQSVFELERLTAIDTGCKVTVDPVPERVRVTMPEGCSDASLQNIEISPGELEFDPMDFSYEVPVGYGPESVTVTPTASESEAVITVNGNTVVSGEDVEIDLNEEEPSIVNIVVTALDGMTTRTYEITVTRCGEDDMWALSRFYEAVGGQNWNDNTNWNSQEPLDLWFGVGTDEDGRVISLHLQENSLSGEIPRELVCLSEIKELALWDNDSLSGKEPDELALAVERAVLRDVAEALELNPGWFDDYEDPFSFSDWHEGVTTDDDERVTELDFTGEDITGEIPGSVFELKRLTAIETGCEVTLEIEAPGRVSVVPDECPEETPPEDMEEEEMAPEDMEEEETAASGGGGCALSQGDSSVSGFGLFLVTILVFAALGRRRAQR